MRWPAASLFLLLVTGALSGAPADSPSRTLRVTLVAPGAEATAIGGVVTLRPIMGPHEPLTAPVQSLGDAVPFRVAPNTMWEASAAIRGFWAAPTSVAVQETDAAATLTLVPAGLLVGRLVPPLGEARPTTMTAKIDPVPGQRLAGPAAESKCDVLEDGTFSCDAPAGTVDVSLRVPGYVGTYRWAVKVPHGGRAELGPIPLSSGSAVSGFVSLRNGKLQPGKGTVALFRPAIGATATASRLSRPVADAPVAENGFFQLRDIPPGRYSLLASYPGFASAVLEGVQVYPRVEAKLPHLIELQPPITLTLMVDPPLDPAGHPWKLELSREMLPGRFAAAPEYTGDMKAGTVTLRQQQGGHYRVRIRDAAGSPFYDEDFTTAGGASESHTFKVKAIRVEGTVHRGDAPLEATLWFGGPYGARHVALRSDAGGSFDGVLPEAGSWRVVVETAGHATTELRADVTKADDREAAHVDLSVPANRVAGMVVDSQGAPFPGATVLLSDGPVVETQRTDEAGAFAFDGIAAGSFTLEAHVEQRAGLKASDVYRASVGATDTLDNVALKLQDGVSIHGRLMGSDGPAAGADVKLRPGSGLDFAPISRATSGPDGVFDVHVPPGYDRALVTVSAPGYALRVFDVAVDGRAMTLNLSQAGGTLQLHLPSDAGGLIVFQDGRLVNFTDLVTWMSAHGDPMPNESSSTLSVSAMAPGRYRACTGKRGATSLADLTRCADGFLAPYGELRLSLR